MWCSISFQPVTRLIAMRPGVSRSSEAAILAIRVGCHSPGCTAGMAMSSRSTSSPRRPGSRPRNRRRGAARHRGRGRSPTLSAAHRTSLASSKAGSTSPAGSGFSAPADRRADLLRSHGEWRGWRKPESHLCVGIAARGRGIRPRHVRAETVLPSMARKISAKETMTYAWICVCVPGKLIFVIAGRNSDSPAASQHHGWWC